MTLPPRLEIAAQVACVLLRHDSEHFRVAEEAFAIAHRLVTFENVERGLEAAKPGPETDGDVLMSLLARFDSMTPNLRTTVLAMLRERYASDFAKLEGRDP